MTRTWMSAAVLGSILIAGCSNTPQNPEETQETAPEVESAGAQDQGTEQPESVSPGTDTGTSASAPPTSRPAPSRPAPAPSRPSAPAASGETPRAPGESARPQEPAAEAPSAQQPAPPKVEYREIRVPAGTALPLELLTDLSSETAKVETPVRARLKQGISVDGVTVLPAGTELRGNVTEVAQAGRVKGRARLSFTFTEAVVNGVREELTTNPITFEAQSTRGEDAAKIGVGAGIGAAIGGILGGGSGAAKGAAIGGGVGTGAVLATKGVEVTVASGTDLAATLAEPYSTKIRVE